MENAPDRGFTMKAEASRTKGEIFMAKATSRKHATHKKARGHHAAKPHARRSNMMKSSASGAPAETKVEPEIVDDDFASRAESRTVEDDSEEEVGIYGPNRGETAG
jgi:hypothetical protein